MWQIKPLGLDARLGTTLGLRKIPSIGIYYKNKMYVIAEAKGKLCTIWGFKRSFVSTLEGQRFLKKLPVRRKTQNVHNYLYRSSDEKWYCGYESWLKYNVEGANRGLERRHKTSVKIVEHDVGDGWSNLVAYVPARCILKYKINVQFLLAYCNIYVFM
jgi:hypothetical protein